MLSFGVVQHIRRLSGEKKVGHTGTLDPQATGLLILCLGRATKLVESIMAGEKEYEGEMVIGVRTDSLDGDGTVTHSMETSVVEEDVRVLLPRFTGTIMQIPPMVSAARHQGQRLYDLARAGHVVERAPKKITVHSFELTQWTPGPQPRARFRVLCSKGTYVRSLVSDIGDLLGVGAYLSALRRTRSGTFSVQEARPLLELDHMAKQNELSHVILPMTDAIRRIKNGAPVISP